MRFVFFICLRCHCEIQFYSLIERIDLVWGKCTFHNGNEDIESTAEDTEYTLTIRKRVIQFIHKWVIAVRSAVFEEPLTTAFIEVK